MAKKVVKKASKPAPKKAAKPAAKKPAAKPVKKAAKPAPKKVSKPAPKPAKKAKVVAKPVKKVAKPAPKAKVVAKPATKAKPAAKPTKVIKPAPAKPISKVLVKSAKPNTKGKVSKKKKDEDEEEEEDDLDLPEDEVEEEEDDVLVDDADLEPVIEDLGEIDILDDDEDEPKRGRGRRKKEEKKKSYDSENFVRKQVVKIDLTKSLLKKSNENAPKPFVNTTDKRSRYSDKELAEFKALIVQKLAEARADYELLRQTISHADDHGTDDTSPTFKLLEDGSDVLSKEETAQLASRQEKYIVNLQNALIRIENKSYGVCRVTGKLIPKERLRSVPHATLSIDAKLNQK